MEQLLVLLIMLLAAVIFYMIGCYFIGGFLTFLVLMCVMSADDKGCY